MTDVVVLERGTLGSGSSAKPLGGVRATFSDANNVELGLRSLRAFETFADRFGIDIGLRQVGYLFLCRTEAELAAVEASVRLQNRLGGDSRMLTPAEACEINPMLDPGPLLGASFSPRDGYAEPARVVEGYAGPPPGSGSGAASTPRSSSSPPTRPVPIRSGPSGVHHRRHGGHHRRCLVDQAGRDARRAPARRGHPPAGRLHPAAGPAPPRSAVHPRPVDDALLPQLPQRAAARDLQRRTRIPASVASSATAGPGPSTPPPRSSRRRWSGSRSSAAGPVCTRTPPTTTP